MIRHPLPKSLLRPLPLLLCPPPPPFRLPPFPPDTHKGVCAESKKRENEKEREREVKQRQRQTETERERGGGRERGGRERDLNLLHLVNLPSVCWTSFLILTNTTVDNEVTAQVDHEEVQKRHGAVPLTVR